MEYQTDVLLYHNPLSCPQDVQDFILEGDAEVRFDRGRMRMQNRRDPKEGQKANFVYWCPRYFPDRIKISWDFYPIREPGLCILFFAADTPQGQGLFSSGIAPRTGEYPQYHHGDFNALHVSYFRRKAEEERAFHVCNLRKSYGFHLVAQGADPLPSVEDARPPYHIEVIKYDEFVCFKIQGLTLFEYQDDGLLGPVLKGGYIGFRQMAPLVAEYADLKVESLVKVGSSVF